MLRALFYDARTRSLKPLIIDETKLLEQLYAQLDTDFVDTIDNDLGLTIYADFLTPTNLIFLGPLDEEGNDTDVSVDPQTIGKFIEARL